MYMSPFLLPPLAGISSSALFNEEMNLYWNFAQKSNYTTPNIFGPQQRHPGPFRRTHIRICLLSSWLSRVRWVWGGSPELLIGNICTPTCQIGSCSLVWLFCESKDKQEGAGQERSKLLRWWCVCVWPGVEEVGGRNVASFANSSSVPLANTLA